MKTTTKTLLRRALAAAALAALMPLAGAATLRMSDQGDAMSMDPHSLQESLQLSFLANVYEPLVGRGRDFKLTPMLATRWEQTAPTVWRFHLRQGVTFQDGTPFTADDVLFSYERTRSESSDTKLYVAPVKEVRKIDDHTIEMVTRDPFPILPDLVSGWLIMSKAWSEKNQSQAPTDVRKGKENYASTHANGSAHTQRTCTVSRCIWESGLLGDVLDGNQALELKCVIDDQDALQLVLVEQSLGRCGRSVILFVDGDQALARRHDVAHLDVVAGFKAQIAAGHNANHLAAVAYGEARDAQVFRQLQHLQHRVLGGDHDRVVHHA